jgi:glyceraldehyde 3-phosphate dehydrogenase
LTRILLTDPRARKHITIGAINIGPAHIEHTAHLFKYDTIMGTFAGSVTMKGSSLIINDVSIPIIAQVDPQKIGWRTYDIDWVVEATGHFTTRERAQYHITAGAHAVLITAPATHEDVAIIPGINEHQFNPARHTIVSLGSCTTNAFIPMLKIIDDAFGITHGLMTTTHAYTNSQVLLDIEGEDLRRSRAAALNIIPTTTGASSMLDKVMPSLAGKIKASSMRVPVGIVSLIDLSFCSSKSLTAKAINTAFIEASHGALKNIVAWTDVPLVSSDYQGNSFSVTVDGQLTDAVGTMGKVFGWYDNEWGYSSRLKDFLVYADSKG